jgi:hypothetical protein
MIRPRGIPWPPKAMSSDKLPVGIPWITWIASAPKGMIEPSPNCFSICWSVVRRFSFWSINVAIA